MDAQGCVRLLLMVLAFHVVLCRCDGYGSHSDQRAIEQPKHDFMIIVMPGTGHHQRMSSISFELYRRGHSITYVSTDYLKVKFDNDLEHFLSTLDAESTALLGEISFFSVGSSDDLLTENERRRDLSELSGVAPAEWHRYMQTPLYGLMNERKPDMLIIDAMATVGYDLRLQFDLPAVAVHPATINLVVHQDWSYPSLGHNYAWNEASDILGHFLAVLHSYMNVNDWRPNTRDLNAIRMKANPSNLQLDPMRNYWFDIPNFVFSLPSLNTNQAYPEFSVINIGLPIHSGLESELESDVLEWIEADSRPVVYVAFGTVALPSTEYVVPLENGLRNGPWKVIWAMRPNVSRYFEETGEDTWKTADNFLVLQWVSQPALLRHPRVELFVTHGGCNSISEAIASGTPMICVPYLGDQPSNCHRAAEAGVAMRMIEGYEQAIDGSGYQRMISRALGMIETEADPSLNDFVRRKSKSLETYRELKKAAAEMKLLSQRVGRSDVTAANLLEYFVAVKQDSLRDASTFVSEGKRMGFDLVGATLLFMLFIGIFGYAVNYCFLCCCYRRRK